MKQLDPGCPAALHHRSGRFVIRSMTQADLEAITIPWMRDAGWNPGLHDAVPFLAADSEGFLLGELDGQPIGCVSGVRYDDTFAFLGCYLVLAGHRGQGYGLALHEAARARLQGCVQGGDGVLGNVPLYQRIGRVLAYRNARFEGVRPANLSCPAPVQPLHQVPWREVLELDRTCFPAPRSRFLQEWIRQPGTRALALRRDGPPDPEDPPLRGFGVIRPCHRGWKVGPLFALGEATAGDLLDALLATIPEGDPYYLDIPGPNAAAAHLVQQRNLKEVFATARMYTGPAPSLRLDRIFGITSFELG